MADMMNNDSMAKEGFKLLSLNQARQILRKFIINEAYVEELVNMCGNEVLTGHILTDACTHNLELEGIKKDIKTAVEEAQQFDHPHALTINMIHTEKELEDLAKMDKPETEDEKKKRVGYPDTDIEQLLKDLDHEKAIEKLKEHEINAELFWALPEGEMNDMLGITEVFGDRKKFHEKIAQIKKDWNEKKEKEYKESKKVNTDGIRQMLTKLATSNVKKVKELDSHH